MSAQSMLATGLDSERAALSNETTLARWTRPGRVFACFFLAYLATWGGHYTSGDGATKRAWALAIWERQTADLDPGPAVAYSKYGIGHTLLGIPPLAGSRAVEALGGPRCEAALYTLIFVVNGAAFLALVASYLRARFPAPDVAVALVLLGFATTWWPHTRLDFTEPLVATALLGGFLLLRRGHPLAGALAASASGLLKVEGFLLVAVLVTWWAWSSRSKAQVAMLVAGTVPAVLIHLWSSWLRDWQAGYAGEQFSTPLLAGLHGLLLSGGKSVILFSPPLLLALAALPRFRRERRHAEDAALFVAVFLTQLLLYARWWDWSGDDAWGPRFLVPGVMLLCIPIVAAATWRRAVALTLAAGVAVQLLAVATSPLEYVVLIRRHDMRRASLFHGGQQRLDFEDVRFNLRYSQMAGHWILLRYALGVPPPSGTADASRSGTPLHDMLRPDEWQAAARVDLFWLRALGSLGGTSRPSDAAEIAR
jgi:hypothetical protein